MVMRNNPLYPAKEHPLYSTWKRMRQRCNDINDNNYDCYGGRGIKVCDRWSSFEVFASDMGEKPHQDYQIDRIDNDGNYEPNNCRWASRKEQNDPLRTGNRKSNKSGIKGVYMNTREQRWRASATIDGLKTLLYNGFDFFEACCARKKYEAKLQNMNGGFA